MAEAGQALAQLPQAMHLEGIKDTEGLTEDENDPAKEATLEKKVDGSLNFKLVNALPRISILSILSGPRARLEASLT
jgi:hypothetical protein